jgi:hypothetical protein
VTWGQIRGCASAKGVFAGSGNPAIASYRFRALKVSPGQKHHGIVTKNSNPMTGAMGGGRGRNSERGADWDSKASEFRESYMSDVPQIHGEAAEQVG